MGRRRTKTLQSDAWSLAGSLRLAAHPGRLFKFFCSPRPATFPEARPGVAAPFSTAAARAGRSFNVCCGCIRAPALHYLICFEFVEAPASSFAQWRRFRTARVLTTRLQLGSPAFSSSKCFRAEGLLPSSTDPSPERS